MPVVTLASTSPWLCNDHHCTQPMYDVEEGGGLFYFSSFTFVVQLHRQKVLPNLDHCYKNPSSDTVTEVQKTTSMRPLSHFSGSFMVRLLRSILWDDDAGKVPMYLWHNCA